ncbi:hypothetical protein Bca4012_002681 [Brassica carinata]
MLVLFFLPVILRQNSLYTMECSGTLECITRCISIGYKSGVCRRNQFGQSFCCCYSKSKSSNYFPITNYVD